MIAALIICLVLLVLYLQGFLPVSSKRATTYVGHGGWGHRSVGASFTACSGQIHRIVRFRESRSYSFQLTGHLSQGEVSVQILDGRRAPVLHLDAANPSGILSAEKGKRYFLYIRFRNASGDYQLDWS